MVDEDFDVTSAIANRMSLFYAHATPMLNMLSDTTSRFVSEVSASLRLCGAVVMIEVYAFCLCYLMLV